MTIDFYKLFFLIILGISIYYYNLWFAKNLKNGVELHQKFTANRLANPIGGYIIFLFVVFYNNNFELKELFFIFSIFFLGILSDNKIFNSPLKRLIAQIIIIALYVWSTNTQIVSTRIDFFDQLLNIKFINMFFTIFCILILLNGSNFIDGLNGLLIGYYTVILLVIVNIDTQINFNLIFLNNFILVLTILLVLNYLNKIFLGDNGAYLLGFIFSYILIQIHQSNSNISPYFIILLLWYPCFENLFSIIRKIKFKNSPTFPDNFHFHQLLFVFLKKKLNSNNKLLINNLSSIVINLYHIPIFIFAMKNFDKTTIQLSLILINIIIYFVLYIFFYNYQKLKDKHLS